jgi:phage terminase large subunit
MVLKFDTHDNEKQKQVARLWCDKVTTDIVYGGSKGSGKSYLGVSLIFGDALIYPETYYFIARKSLTNLRKFTIPSIHEVFKHWGLNEKYWRYNGQDNYFELYNKSRVYLLDAAFLPSDPEYYRFGSMQMTRGFIEEAGEFEEGAKNNLTASIGRWKNDVYNLTPKLLQTCNPSKNYLYREYYRPFHAGTLPAWRAFIQALPQDNKQLPAGYLENLERTLNKNERKRLLHGEWEIDDDPSILIDYEKILDVLHEYACAIWKEVYN